MAIGSLASTSPGSDNRKRKILEADDSEKLLCLWSQWYSKKLGLPRRFQYSFSPPWVQGHMFAGGLSHCVQQDVRCETKTKDNVFVKVVASVQFRPMKEIASNAFCNRSNTAAEIQANVFDVIRASVPKLNLDTAFEQKNDIARVIKDKLEKAMSASGFEIVQTLIVDIEPDDHVKKAKDEINADADSSCGSNGNLYPVFWDSPSRYPHVKYHGDSRKRKAGSQDVRLEHENAMLKKQLKEERSKSKAFLERIISLERIVKNRSKDGKAPLVSCIPVEGPYCIHK